MQKSHLFLFRKPISAIYKTPGLTRNFFWRDAKDSANATETVPHPHPTPIFWVL